MESEGINAGVSMLAQAVPHNLLDSASAANLLVDANPQAIINEMTGFTNPGLNDGLEGSKPKKARAKRSEYKSFTIEKKLELIKQFKEAGGRNVRSFAVANGINEQTFYNWVHKFDKGNFVGSPNPKRKRARESIYPAVEAELLKFMETHESMSKSTGGGDKPPGISWLTLQTKASEIAQSVLSPEQRAAFKSSSGWIRNLIRRNNLGQRMNPDSSAPGLTEAQIAAITSSTVPNPMMDASDILRGSGLEGSAEATLYTMSGMIGVPDTQLFLSSLQAGVDNSVPQLVYSEANV